MIYSNYTGTVALDGVNFLEAAFCGELDNGIIIPVLSILLINMASHQIATGFQGTTWCQME